MPILKKIKEKLIHSSLDWFRDIIPAFVYDVGKMTFHKENE